MADHIQPTSQDSRLTAIKQRLGLPDYEAPNVLLYKGDCLELMKLLGEDVFDLVVTSPPYNIGKAYEQTRSLEEYLAWSEKWIEEVYRLTKAQGSFWLNLGYLTIPNKAHAIPISYLLWDKIPFYLIQEVVWNYGAGVAAKKFFSPRNEKFMWYVKDANSYTFNLDDVRDPNVKYPNQKKNGKIKVNPLGKNPTDVWQIPKVTSGQNRSSKERMAHPAQFPQALIERIIKSSSNEGDIIFDPFMGSGTTAETAIRNNRVVVGFEVKKEYIEVISGRLEKVIKEQLGKFQGVLF
jgi:adenine-specific DNA-methyltransferase